MPFDISVVGPLNVDMLIRGDGPTDWKQLQTWAGPADVNLTAAGSIGYTVQDMVKLGLSVQVCSALSGDTFGEFIYETLKDAEIDLGLVERYPGATTGIAVYILLFGNRKRPLAYHLPTHPMWRTQFSKAAREKLLDARALHVGGYLHFQDCWHGELTDLYREAKARGLMTSIDPQFPLFDLQPPWLFALEDVLPYVDYLLCDEHEARCISGVQSLDDAAKVLLDSGVGCAILKQGADGSTIYTRERKFHQPAISLGELVDSIGAGDAYDSGFIYGTLQGWPLEHSALFASVAAGYTVTGVGGSQTMPTVESINAAIKRLKG